MLVFLTAVFSVFVILAIVAKINKPDSIYSGKPSEQNPMQGKMVRFVENPEEKDRYFPPDIMGEEVFQYILNSRTIIHTTMLLSDIDSRSSAACLSMLSSTVCVFRLRPHEVTSSHLPPPVGWCSSANRLHGAYS